MTRTQSLFKNYTLNITHKQNLIIIITNIQNTIFFADNDQMSIDMDTVTQILEEGITKISDLDNFRDEELKQLCENFKDPPGIPDPVNPV